MSRESGIGPGASPPAWPSPAAAAAAGLHGALAAAHPAAFTIEQVLRPAFPSSLTAAPRGHAVAWVFDIQGSCNVWGTDAAHGMKARAVTAFSGHDGFIGELDWSPDRNEPDR
jgi:hypothetical protein